jgi:photosystem II stability/assembly factor-like uncharacterized protein
MKELDDPLDLVNGLRPVMLDRLADDAYARRRSDDLARVANDREGESPRSRIRPRRPGTAQHSPRWSLLPGRRPAAAAAAAAAAVAVALLVVVAQLGPWHPGTPAQRSGPAAGPGSTGPSVGRTEPPETSPRMRLVASVSTPFQSAGNGPQANSMVCVTASVCYVWNAGSEGQQAERTSDGGAIWRALAALPGHRSLTVNAGPPSCPTADVCVGAAGGRTLAVTSDGGAHWRLESVPAPPGVPGAAIDEVSCASVLTCVVHIGGTFMSTVNGGRTWTGAAVMPRGAPGYLWYLRCDPDGRCIGLTPTGTSTNGGIVSMLSADNGRTWVVSGSHHTPPSDIFMVSCGDALHCMVLSDGGATMTTSDGGFTWHQTAPVSTSPGTEIPLSVSCAAALDCFVSVSRLSAATQSSAGPGSYEDATIEATRNGGATWTTIALPAVGATQLAEVYPVSCPNQAGCVGVAATPQQANDAGPEGSQREIISSFPAAGRAVTGG